jgi:hypothetical protein
MRIAAAFALVAVLATACKTKSEEPPPPAPTEATAAATTPPAPPPAEALDATPAAPPPTPTEQASIGRPFTIVNRGETKTYAEACLMPPAGGLNIAVLRDVAPGQPCDVAAHRGEAAIGLLVAGSCAGTPCPLPAPGATFEALLSIVDGDFSGPAKVTVLRHEKPALVIRVAAEGGDEGAFTDLGGELRVSISPLAAGAYDPASWR